MNISRPHQDRTKGTSEEGKGQTKFEESDNDDSNGDYKHNNDDTVDDASMLVKEMTTRMMTMTREDAQQT